MGMHHGRPASRPARQWVADMSLARIVVIEDDKPIREGVGASLRAAGYATVEAADGRAGLAEARRQNVDLVLLDLMLPKMDGTEVLTQLRTTHPTLPVIILTARGDEDDRVAGLRDGADDYVVKPFSARELIARVQAVLRRSPERPSGVERLDFGTAEVDFERREIVKPDGPPESLSQTECDILSHLARNAGRAISRDELLARVWGISGQGIETRTIDMHVARLRGKLAKATGISSDRLIATVRGRGYMLGPEARPARGRSEA